MSALFDSGADLTTVDPEWKERLRVPDAECIPWTQTFANGTQQQGELTILDATLDGHTFRMPVVFLAGVPVDLVGRVGVFDQFTITHANSIPVPHSRYSWAGPLPDGPWARPFEVMWKQARAAAGAPNPAP